MAGEYCICIRETQIYFNQIIGPNEIDFDKIEQELKYSNTHL